MKEAREYKCQICGRSFYRKYVYDYKPAITCSRKCQIKYVHSRRNYLTPKLIKYAIMLYYSIPESERHGYVSIITKAFKISREAFYENLRNYSKPPNILFCHNGHRWLKGESEVCPVCGNKPLE